MMKTMAFLTAAILLVLIDRVWSMDLITWLCGFASGGLVFYWVFILTIKRRLSHEEQ